MRVGIDAHMIGDHSGGNESFYTNIINNMNPRNAWHGYIWDKRRRKGKKFYQ